MVYFPLETKCNAGGTNVFPSNYMELLAWNNRNRAYFDNKPMQPHDIMLRAQNQWMEVIMTREAEPKVSILQRGSAKWRKL